MSSKTPTALDVINVAAEAIRAALGALPADDTNTPGARSTLASCANILDAATSSMAAHKTNGAN